MAQLFAPLPNNGYDVFTSIAVEAMAAAQVPSATISQDLSGKKIVVGVIKTVAGNDVSAALGIQGSVDGTNWFTVNAAIIADTTPNVDDTIAALVDLTAMFIPYYRLVYNWAGDATGTTGRFKFFYALPK